MSQDPPTVNERRAYVGLPPLPDVPQPRGRRLRRAQHVRRLQNQHEKTVQLMQDYEDMQDVLAKFDHRVHWLDWDSIEEGKASVAHCGAVVHDGTTWLSTAAIFNLMDTVTCEDCCALPEYNLKLLAQTDLGDVKVSDSTNTVEPMPIPTGISEFIDFSYGSDK